MLVLRLLSIFWRWWALIVLCGILLCSILVAILVPLQSGLLCRGWRFMLAEIWVRLIRWLRARGRFSGLMVLVRLMAGLVGRRLVVRGLVLSLRKR